MGGSTTNNGRQPVPSNMARRRKSRVYKQVKTGTNDMGNTGDQKHIGKVTKLDPSLKGAYLKNVVVSMQLNQTVSDDKIGAVGFTVYLSNNSGNDGWSDDAVVGARSIGGSAGNCSLTANRRIMTDESEATSSSGPIHIWAEVTDHSGALDDVSARITIEAWGRMILLTDFFD